MKKLHNLQMQKIKMNSNEEISIQKAVELFVKKTQQGFETRYKTWDNCHKYFVNLYKSNKDKLFDDLSECEQEMSLLQLGYYLASWGMYRGSSFVLQYDNSIYKEVISILLNSKYDKLWDLSFECIKQDAKGVQELLVDLRDSIMKSLYEYRHYSVYKGKLVETSKDEKELSQTLVTKILLGTLCCCPAYDTYFCSAIGGSYNSFFDDKKILNLLYIVSQNDIFNKLSQKYNYPVMKIVDMAYFTIGIEKGFKKYYEEYILKDVVPKTQKECNNFVKQLNMFYFSLKNTNEKADVYVSFDCKKAIVEQYRIKHLDEIMNFIKK
jgi:hypothetical protein